MSYLQNITRFSKADNIGGIVELQVMRAADISSIGDAVDGVIYGAIVMKAGKSPVTWQVSFESNRLQSASKTTREGVGKSNKTQFVIPKDRPTIKSQLDQAEEDEFVILYKDSNGQNILFGTVETPVRFEYDHDSGASINNFNGYSCRFYFDGPDNRYHYNGDIPSPTPGAAPSIVRYNGVAIASLAAGEEINIISEFGFTEFHITS